MEFNKNLMLNGYNGGTISDGIIHGGTLMLRVTYSLEIQKSYKV